MDRISGLLAIILVLTGCADRDPEATRILQAMESTGTAPQTFARASIAWNETIDSRKFGLASSPTVDGKTLAQIITSQTSGRDDGLLCSACHNSSDSQGGYGVPAARNASSAELKPNNLIGQRAWIGADGWAERFAKNNTKPDNLRIMIQAWINNGYK